MTSYGSLPALVNRLSLLIERGHRLTLVVGSGLTVGAVPGVSTMLSLTETFVAGENNDDLTAALVGARKGSRTAAETYGKYRQTVNEWLPAPGFDLVVQAAVLRAYPKAVNRQPWREISRLEAQQLEDDTDSWTIPPGVAALAEILTKNPESFGHRVFTPNFDPLLEIAIRRHRQRAVTLSLKTDGSFSSVIDNDAFHVIHLHGYWRLGDSDEGRPMLHDPNQLTKNRPTLQTELSDFMQSTTVCAIGYGGWDDIFIRTLAHVARARSLQIMWGFHAFSPESLRSGATPILRRFSKANSLVCYRGIDSDAVFPSLLERLKSHPNNLVSLPVSLDATVERDSVTISPRSLGTTTGAPSDILSRLDRFLGWRWDQGSWGSSREPELLYWSIRLRRRSVIHAVQARVAAALSALDVKVTLCVDDLGIENAAQRTEEFTEYVGRIFSAVPGATAPTVVSLQAHLASVEGLSDIALGARTGKLPETPWRVLQCYLGQTSPSIVDVLTVSKIIDFSIDVEREDQLEIIRHALERRDGNKLLTPITLWTHINHVVNNSHEESVITLGGRDEAPLWHMWRSVFGRAISHLFNPRLSNLHQDSGFVRWDSGGQLRDYLLRARELPNWDQSGRLIPWLYTNTVLLKSLLNGDANLPVIDGQVLSGWPMTRNMLISHKRETLDALAAVIVEFFEPGMGLE